MQENIEITQDTVQHVQQEAIAQEKETQHVQVDIQVQQEQQPKISAIWMYQMENM